MDDFIPLIIRRVRSRRLLGGRPVQMCISGTPLEQVPGPANLVLRYEEIDRTFRESGPAKDAVPAMILQNHLNPRPFERPPRDVGRPQFCE